MFVQYCDSPKTMRRTKNSVTLQKKELEKTTHTITIALDWLKTQIQIHFLVRA